MKIQYEEASIEDIILHWVKDYELPESQSIIRHEWAANPATGKVVIKLIVKESTLSTNPVSDDQQAKDAALVEALRSAEDWIEGVPHGDNCWLHGRHENVPNNGCYCGKDAVIAIIDAALSATKQEEV